MAAHADAKFAQPALDPGKLKDEGLERVREDWRHAMHVYQPCDGLHVNCINGRPGSKWAFAAEGPPAFSLNILLEGRLRTALDDGPVIDARAGSAIVMASSQHARGGDELDGQSGNAFRLVSIHMPQTAVAGLTGLRLEDFRHRFCPSIALQAHVNAHLGMIPLSSGLQRVAYELLEAGGTSVVPDVVRPVYLRAKAFEAIACFMRESLTPDTLKLPVPADRQRLTEARDLLQQRYGQDWSVRTLAHAVGLNEKRLQSGFQALFGSSVHTYLTRVRIDAAIALLRQGNSVTETAARCGFAHLSHFSRIFRHHTGMTPKQCGLGRVVPKGMPSQRYN